MKKKPYDIQNGLIYVPFNKKDSDLKKGLSDLMTKMFPTSSNVIPLYHGDKISQKFVNQMTVDEFKDKYEGHLIISSHCNYGTDPKMTAYQGGSTSKERLTASDVLQRIKKDIPHDILNNTKLITLLACYGGGLDAVHATAFEKCTGKQSISFLKKLHNEICNTEHSLFVNLTQMHGFTRAVAITGQALIFVKAMKDTDNCYWGLGEEESNTVDHLEFIGDSSLAFFTDFC